MKFVLSLSGNQLKHKVMARMKKGLYKSTWTKTDTILTFFCEKYGVNNLVSSYCEDAALETIANEYIGSVVGSLKQQMSNFRYLLTNGEDGLSDYSVLQNDVFNECGKLDKNEFRNVCLELMSEINTVEVYKNFNKVLLENQYIDSVMKAKKNTEQKRISFNEQRKKEQIEHAAAKLGKNPKKLLTMEEYLKKQAEKKQTEMA
jgi:hypothetical protein